jgi:hypothetical protein
MPIVQHWLTELADVYARHVGRHGPNRLLPAEVLPAHGRAPGYGGASPQGLGCDGCTAEPSAPKACTPQRSTEEERHTMAHDAQHGSSDNRHGAVDRDRLREEIHLLEMSLGYWQARWQHMPGPCRAPARPATTSGRRSTCCAGNSASSARSSGPQDSASRWGRPTHRRWPPAPAISTAYNVEAWLGGSDEPTALGAAPWTG